MTAQPSIQQQCRLPRGTLDRSTVVDAALEVANRDGLGAVTMARVANELGTSAMSLYRHVRDKQDLLEAIADAALAEIPAIAQDGQPWRLRLEEWAFGVRRVALRHPALVEVVLDQGVYGPAATAVGLDCIALLRAAGFDDESSFRGYMALRNHLLGSLFWEISRFRQGSAEFWRQEVRSLVRHDTPADSPLWQFAEVVADDPQAQFAFALRRLLDGFELEPRSVNRTPRAEIGKDIQ